VVDATVTIVWVDEGMNDCSLACIINQGRRLSLSDFRTCNMQSEFMTQMNNPCRTLSVVLNRHRNPVTVRHYNNISQSSLATFAHFVSCIVLQQHSQLMSWHCSYPSIRSVYFESGNMAHKSREMISF